jgi:hypothetical protein
LTSALGCAGQGVKLPFLSKKCIFRAEKGIFSKSSFYTKMISDPKYNFSVCLGSEWWKYDFLKIHFSADFSLEGHLLRSIIS